MRKRIMAIVLFILMINMGIVVNAQQDGIIRVYGTVIMDSDPLEDASIKVINEDTGQEWITKTDSNGSYDILVPAKNNDRITVIASYKDMEAEKGFVVQSNQKSYQIDFEFELPPEVAVVKKIVGFLFGFDIFLFLIYLILVLIVICLIAKLHKVHKRD